MTMSIWFDSIQFFQHQTLHSIYFNFWFLTNFRYANSAQGGTTAGCPGGPVKVSFVSLPKPVQPVQQQPAAAAAVGQGTLEATEASTAVTVTGSSAPTQGNLLRGIVNWSGAAWSVGFSNTFSLFQLESKPSFYKQCWPYMVCIQKIIFEKNYT